MMRHDERIPALRSEPTGTVDRKANVVYGAKLIELGDLNEGDARAWFVDESTLMQVAEFANRPNKGLKARWTHPNMSSDGLGKFLGHWKDARLSDDGQAIVADLHIADVAFKSPGGNLGEWVLDMAEEHPEEFGVSVAAKSLDLDAMEAGKREDDERLPIRFTGLHAADVVDTPAATRGGLFSTDASVAIPAQVTWLLEQHFADSEPVEVAQRAIGLLSKHYGVDVMADLLEAQGGQVETSEAPEQEQDLTQEQDFTYMLTRDEAKEELSNESEAYREAFGAQGAEWFLEGKSLLECYQIALAAANLDIEQLEAENDELQVRLEAALEVAGLPEDSISASTEPQVDLSEAAKAKQAKAEELKEKGVDPVVAKFGAALSSGK